MKGFYCVHGHFYQPPREDPWTGEVPKEASAKPFHDWNQKITAECYLPNTEARILGASGKVKKVWNNFSHMSFDVGPTLLKWMRREAPAVYEKILQSDRDSRLLFQDHGNAMAQAYNHIILPLANERDKETQLIWAVKDFSYRFGRAPEGLWLPETAVDLRSLEIMARLGIRFTLLAPHQAERHRFQGETHWNLIRDQPLDPTVPYRVSLPSSDSIVVFFYHEGLSKGLAFENLLQDGENLKKSFLSALPVPHTWPRLLSVATDGETFGHHHRFGEMALAYLLYHLEMEKSAELINYGAYLEKFPVLHEAVIRENTSWSCVHGVGRWSRDCGCHMGGHEAWNQAWRKPLREALDWLRDAAKTPFEEAGGKLFRDPWEARNDFIELLLETESEPETRNEFFRRHSRGALSPQESATGLELMQLQYHLMAMYTSCGWFFDDPGGLETALILRHAARALEILKTQLQLNYEEDFLKYLSKMESNRPEIGDGRKIFQHAVAPDRRLQNFD